MIKFFQNIKNAITGNITSIPIIDDAPKVRIDSSALHCPICISVFGSAPAILSCGHSFCVTCIQQMIKLAIRNAAPMQEPLLECALCRAQTSANLPLVRNFAIEAILQSADDSLHEANAESDEIQGYQLTESKDQVA
uniref:RING-type domain-containing protein n=1 Tax=Acrobeloides nanus TaxID=290746 RepID=A0A914D7L8_9BILA